MTFQDNPVLGRFTQAARAMDERHEELKAAYEHIRQLEEILGECAAWFDQRADVVDGDCGTPAPNAEMKMMCRIDEVLS